jgi:hypothetical protein
MRIAQRAGRVAVEVFTDGAPLWPEIEIEANNGEAFRVRISTNELHDLRYCVDRVLAQLASSGIAP